MPDRPQRLSTDKQEVADLMQITKLYTVFDIYLLLRGI
jgi:hypothetical protein